MKQLFVNPGYSHIAESISLGLDHESLMFLKEEFDPQFLNTSRFWFKKCDFLDQSWKELANGIKINDVTFGTNGEKNLVALLIKIHEDPKMYSQTTPLHMACELGDIQMVKFILRFLDVNCYNLELFVDQHNETPIWLAAKSLCENGGYHSADSNIFENIFKILLPFYENLNSFAFYGWIKEFRGWKALSPIDLCVFM